MLFSKDHEYVEMVDDIATVGVSDYAQKQLGDVVFVELPNVGAKVKKGEAVAVVESVKAASDVFSPVGGEVVEVNGDLDGDSNLVNDDAQGGGWLFKVRADSPKDLEGLMDAAAYAEYLKTIV